MTLGIGIPYYKNSEECEIAFKKLMVTLKSQVGGNIKLFIYEDGQVSSWLYHYSNIAKIVSSNINKGIAYARNYILNYLINIEKVDYILYLDSDDMIDCDYVSKNYAAMCKGEYNMIISRFIMNKKEIGYPTRSNVAGVCLKVDFIKDMRFDEDYIISEDTIFINEVYARCPKIFIIDSNYYYNYGINPNSLMMRYERSEVGIRK